MRHSTIDEVWLKWEEWRNVNVNLVFYTNSIRKYRILNTSTAKGFEK